MNYIRIKVHNPKAAQFAIDENIFLQNFSSLERNENSSGSEFSNMPTENFSGAESSNIFTEYFRVKASNEIRKIDLQLKKIKIWETSQLNCNILVQQF